MKERIAIFERSLHKPRCVLPEASPYWKDEHDFCFEYSFHTRCSLEKVTEQFKKLCNDSNYVVEQSDDETIELGVYPSMQESMQDESKVFIYAYLRLNESTD